MNESGISTGRVVAAVVGCLVFLALLIGALGPGCSAYNRYQTRQDASNQVKVAHIEIEKAAEEAKVNRAQVKATEAEAEKKVAESVGLKKAQVEINKSLTPLYVQHEYVQALEDIAHSPSNTIEFIPVGQSGIPIVQPVAGR
jgi:uncharacterized protein HemX